MVKNVTSPEKSPGQIRLGVALEGLVRNVGAVTPLDQVVHPVALLEVLEKEDGRLFEEELIFRHRSRIHSALEEESRKEVVYQQLNLVTFQMVSWIMGALPVAEAENRTRAGREVLVDG